jgi:hypothetical protein
MYDNCLLISAFVTFHGFSEKSNAETGTVYTNITTITNFLFKEKSIAKVHAIKKNKQGTSHPSL